MIPTDRLMRSMARYWAELALIGACAAASVAAAEVFARATSGAYPLGAVRSLSIGGMGDVVADAISEKLDSDKASAEKRLAGEKELAQAKISQDAMSETMQATGKTGGMAPDACESLESEVNALDAKGTAVTWQKAMTAGSVRSTVGSDNTGAAMREALDIHNEIYCSDVDEARGRCYVPGNGLQNADVMASTVLAPNAGYTLSDEEFEASRMFVSNVTNGVPVQDLQPAFERGPVGQAYLLEQRRQAARLSLAQNSLNRIVASQRVRN